MRMKRFSSDEELREEVAKSLSYRSHADRERPAEPVDEDDLKEAERRLEKILAELDDEPARAAAGGR